MKTRNKALLLSLCAVLICAASVMGTMAYLTGTDEVKNTFTVGKVAIELDEAAVNGDGVPVENIYNGNAIVQQKPVKDPADATRVKANSYKLMPGHEYTKDPTVTIKAGSEDSYVRLLVTATFDKVLTAEQLQMRIDDIFTGYNTNWVRGEDPVVTTNDGKTVISYEYRYLTPGDVVTDPSYIVDGTVVSGERKLPALFTGVKVPGDWTNEQLAAIGGVQINIVAQAIQADGFANVDAAWAAFPTTAE